MPATSRNGAVAATAFRVWAMRTLRRFGLPVGEEEGSLPTLPQPLSPSGREGGQTATLGFVASASLLLALQLWVCLQRLGTAPSPRRLTGFGRCRLCEDSGLSAAATNLHRLQPKGRSRWCPRRGDETQCGCWLPLSSPLGRGGEGVGGWGVWRGRHPVGLKKRKVTAPGPRPKTG